MSSGAPGRGRRDFGSPPRRKRYTLIAVLGRRRWLNAVGAASLTAALPSQTLATEARLVTLFLCGDVMTGRGIDQLLPQSVSPEIFESYLTAADQDIEVAERVSGPIPRGPRHADRRPRMHHVPRRPGSGVSSPAA